MSFSSLYSVCRHTRTLLENFEVKKKDIVPFLSTLLETVRKIETVIIFDFPGFFTINLSFYNG